MQGDEFMPRLSIIVPVYKVEKYIHKCVDSILNQTFKDFELILVDDGSPDNCPQICDNYAKQDKRVRVIHQPNKGLVEARNAGLEMASGEYICFVDSDDFIKGELIYGAFNIIKQHPDIDIIIYDYFYFFDNKDSDLKRHSQDIDNNWSLEKLRDEFLLDNYSSYMWNKVFRKELLKKVSIPAGIWMEDLYACADLFTIAKKIVFVPEAYYCYRKFESVFSKQPKTKKKYGLFLAWREHERVCEEGGFSPLAYSRERARKAAISLKIINHAENILTREQLADVDDYLNKIDNTDTLPIKYRFEYWADKHLPLVLLKMLGNISVWAERQKH